MPQFSEKDLILLNSYVDGRLDEKERAALEARLGRDDALRAELESLGQTVSLLRLAERVPIPRSFTLAPARYGKTVGVSWLERIGYKPSMAGVVAALVLMCAGALLLSSGLLNPRAAATMAPQEAQFAAGESLKAATEVAMEEATEAPALEAGAPSADLSPLATQPPAGTPAALATPDVAQTYMTQPPTGLGGEDGSRTAGTLTSLAASEGAGNVTVATVTVEGGIVMMAPVSEEPTQVAEAVGQTVPDTVRDTRGAANTSTEEPARLLDYMQPWAVMLLGGITLGIGALTLVITFAMRRR